MFNLFNLCGNIYVVVSYMDGESLFVSHGEHGVAVATYPTISFISWSQCFSRFPQGECWPGVTTLTSVPEQEAPSFPGKFRFEVYLLTLVCPPSHLLKCSSMSASLFTTACLLPRDTEPVLWPTLEFPGTLPAHAFAGSKDCVCLSRRVLSNHSPALDLYQTH